MTKGFFHDIMLVYLGCAGGFILQGNLPYAAFLLFAAVFSYFAYTHYKD